MAIFEETMEVHIQGEIKLLSNVEMSQVWAALKPLLDYSNAVMEDEKALNNYEVESGIQFNSSKSELTISWTMQADAEIDNIIEKIVVALNPLSAKGTVLEVSYYSLDAMLEFNPERQGEVMLVFVGPNEKEIAKAQKDTLVQDVLSVLERQFEVEQLDAVFAEIDKLFQQKEQKMTKSLALDNSLSNDKLIFSDRLSRKVH